MALITQRNKNNYYIPVVYEILRTPKSENIQSTVLPQALFFTGH